MRKKQPWLQKVIQCRNCKIQQFCHLPSNIMLQYEKRILLIIIVFFKCSHFCTIKKKASRPSVDNTTFSQFEPGWDSGCVGETETSPECRTRILILKPWITKRLLSIWLNPTLLAFCLPLCDEAEPALCPLPGCSCGREGHKEELNLWCR